MLPPLCSSCGKSEVEIGTSHCVRCSNISIYIDSTPDDVLISLIGPDRMSRIVGVMLDRAVAINSHKGKVPVTEIATNEGRQ